MVGQDILFTYVVMCVIMNKSICIYDVDFIKPPCIKIDYFNIQNERHFGYYWIVKKIVPAHNVHTSKVYLVFQPIYSTLKFQFYGIRKYNFMLGCAVCTVCFLWVKYYWKQKSIGISTIFAHCSFFPKNQYTQSVL